MTPRIENAPSGEMEDKMADEMAGVLHVVATPIGNLEDITLRAMRILSTVDIIAAEDTRHTGKLLAHLDVKCKLISLHEHNEKERASELISHLKTGLSIALVTDAGTPSVSDPGFRLVKEAVASGVKVTPIPGVSAAIAALSASGIPSDSFVFVGFPQKKIGRRTEQLKLLAAGKPAMIFYESPRRVLKFAQELVENMGDRYAVLSREMTKIHEEFIRGNLSELVAILANRPSVKGECTLIVQGNPQLKEALSQEDLIAEISARMGRGSIKASTLAKELAAKYTISRKEIYQEILNLKEGE